MTDDLIAAHADNPKLMPIFICRFRRAATASSGHEPRPQRRRLSAAGGAHPRARPDIAMSGDFIVGFPGETEDDFESTLALAREVGYAFAYSFRYSPRPGTPRRKPRIRFPTEVAQERLHRLQALLHEQQTASMPAWSAVRCRFCWKSRAGGRASSSAVHPTSRPSTSTASGPYRDGHKHPYLRCWNQQPFGPLCPCGLMILEK